MSKKSSLKMTTISGEWIDEIVASVGQHIRLETHDGIVREGRLSSLTTREMLWNGKQVLIPIECELNGDVYDTVSLERIRTIGLIQV